MSVKQFILSMAFISMTLAGVSYPALSWAHEPIFMISPEAPGKGAFDVHTAFEHQRQGDKRALELEQEFTYGLTRDLAFKLSVPFVRDEEITAKEAQDTDQGLGDPTFRFKWRFWDKDLPGAKYSVAGVLQSTLPLGGEMGRDKPSFLGALAHGREGVHWYYFVDARYLYPVEDNETKPGDRLYLDVAYGLRPVLRGLEETDIVYFFELNYLRERRAKINGAADADSGGAFLFFSPEVLISPTNRVMLRGGVQIPILQSLNGRQAPKDMALKVLAEFRF